MRKLYTIFFVLIIASLLLQSCVTITPKVYDVHLGDGSVTTVCADSVENDGDFIIFKLEYQAVASFSGEGTWFIVDEKQTCGE